MARPEFLQLLNELSQRHSADKDGGYALVFDILDHVPPAGTTARTQFVDDLVDCVRDGAVPGACAEVIAAGRFSEACGRLVSLLSEVDHLSDAAERRRLIVTTLLRLQCPTGLDACLEYVDQAARNGTPIGVLFSWVVRLRPDIGIARLSDYISDRADDEKLRRSLVWELGRVVNVLGGPEGNLLPQILGYLESSARVGALLGARLLREELQAPRWKKPAAL
jgi:hypothetical protein